MDLVNAVFESCLSGETLHTLQQSGAVWRAEPVTGIRKTALYSTQTTGELSHSLMLASGSTLTSSSGKTHLRIRNALLAKYIFLHARKSPWRAHRTCFVSEVLFLKSTNSNSTKSIKPKSFPWIYIQTDTWLFASHDTAKRQYLIFKYIILQIGARLQM